MPRSGVNGTYSLPGPQKTQVPNTPILSSVNNQGYADIEQTFNTPTPEAYGGTNASTFAQARINMGLVPGTDFPSYAQVALPNMALAATVAGSALTIALKGANGADPSPTNIVNIPFRNATLATGTPVNIAVTAATSLVISSGSTMGFTSATAGRLWIVGFNDASTFRLGAVNVLSGTSIMALRDGIYSSTAEGGAGAADSAQVIYTGTAVTSKALTILGYMDWATGLTTAGTWAIVPTTIQLMGPGIPKPGDVVQSQRSATSALITSAATIPNDDTIPQISEGVQALSQAITPISSPNLCDVFACIYLGANGADPTTVALFRDIGANALAASQQLVPAAANNANAVCSTRFLFGSAASTTLSVRAGTSVSTISINGSNGARKMGGVANTFVEVKEIMA